MKFWDSSAIVPLLAAEPGRDRVLALLEEDTDMVVWWATPVECASALARREREGRLSIPATTEALDRLRLLSAGWNEVVPTDAVRNTAFRLLRVHSLRAADSLQLAAAVLAAEHDPPSLGFVSLDDRLGEAAQREGFRLWPV
jgi:hypothetical protein